MTKNLSKLSGLLTLSLLLFVGQLFAQSTTTGGINGTVTDPQGKVVPNATITVTNTGTNAVVTAVTNEDGGYRVTNLPPGTYTVETAVSGFAPAKADTIIVEVGSSTPVDIPLTLGSAVAEVEVTAEAPVINTTDNANAVNINQTSINELPINGRRWSEFALLTPSTVPDGTFGLISFRGVSGLLNNNTIDGGDNNQAFFSEERGRTRINYVISQAAIREFQVNTSNYSAEYGRSAGGVVNAVTKSGTNEFHGDLFYYNRNGGNAARNPLSFLPVLGPGGTSTLVPVKPRDVRQQWGGAVGGPIVKDRLFFFFSYDQQSREFPGIATFTNQNFLNTVNRPTLLARGLTNAQIDSSLAFLVSVAGENPRKGDQIIFLPKIDWQINDKNLFNISYNRMRWESPNGVQTAPVVQRARSNWGDDFVSVDSVNSKLQSTLTSTLLNEFRFQWSRDFERQFSVEPLPGEPSTALGGTRSPGVSITGGFEFGTPNFLDRNSFPNEKRLQFADTITWIKGRHNIKFGGDVNFVRDEIENLFRGAGSYSYGNINDFIVDYTNFRTPLPGTTQCATTTRLVGRCYTGQFQQGLGLTGLDLSTTDYNFFIQDDLRWTSRLTFNLGLRYEYIQMPEPQIPSTSTEVIPYDGRTVAEATSTIPSDSNNFGPRFGFAYDVTGNGETSIRGGYGIYYGRIQSSTIYNALINTGNPGGQAQIALQPTDAASPLFPNVLPSSAVGTVGTAVQFFAENFQAPLIHQYDFVFERQIMRNTSVSLSYIGSLGRHLPTFYDLNNIACVALPTPLPAGACPTGVNTTFTFSGGPLNGQTISLPQYNRLPSIGNQARTRIQSTVKSEYNAFVAQINRRFTDGLQFQASYTLAKSTDTNQNSATFTQTNSPYDILDQTYDIGYSNFDRRHKFVGSAVWAPTFYKGGDRWANYAANGWTFSPIFTYMSGGPYSGTISGTSLNRSFGGSQVPLLDRNSFRLPDLMNLDARLSKRFKITESMNLELLAEGFNLLNRTHVFGVETTMYSRAGNATTLTYFPTFGNITGTSSTLYRERQFQLAARFQF
ncbi:MAG TPA: TonB-dependent receptor [Pyrinomonadaceae bacterium]|nr:TonB-dependent receptor [Pyrinomonadaceae bacterium]